jgi:hypothetical protein
MDHVKRAFATVATATSGGFEPRFVILVGLSGYLTYPTLQPSMTRTEAERDAEWRAGNPADSI